MSEERAHAILSASSAERWLMCTPSARLNETFEDKGSDYAREGSLAHEIAELKLRKHFLEPMPLRTYNSKMKKLSEQPLYQDEMQRYTDVYKDYITEVMHRFTSPPYLAVEKKLDYSEYAPEGFGTGDCIIIAGNDLFVIDFKYGKGVPVSAVDNPQMKLYALGAYRAYSMLYPITNIHLIIVQPRLDSISEYDVELDELLGWGESIKRIAQIAFKGEGDFASGEHCRFCGAKALCRARAEFNTGLEEYGQALPPLISNAEVGHILTKAHDLVNWVNALKEYALSECLAGRGIPGFKAVEGGAGNRAFTDIDKAFAVVKTAGYDEVLLYERKPLTLTKVETLLGKKVFGDLLKDFVTKPPGKPALVEATDKRDAISQSMDINLFNDINSNLGGNENE